MLQCDIAFEPIRGLLMGTESDSKAHLNLTALPIIAARNQICKLGGGSSSGHF